MKHVILRVAGTFGSGKTTAVREFINSYPCKTLNSAAGKILGYRIDLSEAGVKMPLFVIGKYDNTCGGTDAISTQAEIAERIMKAHPHGHVIYEGALVSGAGLAGQVTQAIRETGCDVYTFLDTPMDVCIERVKGRRKAAGNEKEFNPKNLVLKFDSVVSTYKTFKREGLNTHLLDYKNINPALLAIIKEFDDA